MDVPEEDGVIFIKNTKKVEMGSFIECEVTAVQEYDLIGEIK